MKQFQVYIRAHSLYPWVYAGVFTSPSECWANAMFARRSGYETKVETSQRGEDTTVLAVQQ